MRLRPASTMYSSYQEEVCRYGVNPEVTGNPENKYSREIRHPPENPFCKLKQQPARFLHKELTCFDIFSNAR